MEFVGLWWLCHVSEPCSNTPSRDFLGMPCVRENPWRSRVRESNSWAAWVDSLGAGNTQVPKKMRPAAPHLAPAWCLCRTVLTLKTGISQGVLTFWRPPSQTKPKLRNRFKICDDATGWPGRQINIMAALTMILGSQTINKLILKPNYHDNKSLRLLYMFLESTQTQALFLFHRSLI